VKNDAVLAHLRAFSSEFEGKAEPLYLDRPAYPILNEVPRIESPAMKNASPPIKPFFYALRWREKEDWGWLYSLVGETTQDPAERLRYATKEKAMAALWKFRSQKHRRENETIAVVRISVLVKETIASTPIPQAERAEKKRLVEILGPVVQHLTTKIEARKLTGSREVQGSPEDSLYDGITYGLEIARSDILDIQSVLAKGPADA
jgi:hypothetical protein